ncbi:MAG TPA: hypothetical protein VNT79_04060, partial [Phycisphaerae bacterium]|nr:hypothetical protein [Phycisphaerae bacterium]
LAVFKGELIAGGWFASPGSYIARWNGTNWHSLAGGTDHHVYTLANYGAELIVGGRFETAGSVSANLVARWDGENWHTLGMGLGEEAEPNDEILEVVGHDGEVFAAGRFGNTGTGPWLDWARWSPNCVRGDLNCDLTVDVADVPVFVDALLNSAAIDACQAYSANLNGDVLSDGTPAVNGLDVQAFVDVLLGQ